ncbi:MAG: hypothetical protein A2Y67_03340 [Candidatus Buchananbacteria bacterium RBG_13_39_9]|uniref:Uncharacterized protein n=1 Tax=Candidatus Buchananbacteria bacterium RBG_13_39_9 TaxID=1797531 RepID=A0A1G1XTQ3_9BACT|nr:MAG: hypothetical protein A2Y67_03340 [Candidatus Buchananbacteria bacterium RBG_13_39_9]
MLTQEDIQKLMDVFATKDEIKEMIDPLTTKDDFSDLQTAVDTYAKKADTYFQGMVALAHKVDRHEKWFHLIADKLNIKLEY